MVVGSSSHKGFFLQHIPPFFSTASTMARGKDISPRGMMFNFDDPHNPSKRNRAYDGLGLNPLEVQTAHMLGRIPNEMDYLDLIATNFRARSLTPSVSVTAVCGFACSFLMPFSLSCLRLLSRRRLRFALV